ncbi:MAG: fluoride efflux transporter CrcB [Gemmatimonadota bacterium]
MTSLLVAIGGALGALARYGVAGLVQGYTGARYPWETMLINVSGSLLLGMVLRLFEALPVSSSWRAAVAIGFCGAYTTFSTFSYETVRLIQDRQWLAAAGNVTGNVVFCLIAVFVGFAAAELILRAKRVAP